MSKALNNALKPYGVTIGLNQSPGSKGTWEWFDRNTSEREEGFPTAMACYKSAADHIEEEHGKRPVFNEEKYGATENAPCMSM